MSDAERTKRTIDVTGLEDSQVEWLENQVRSWREQEPLRVEADHVEAEIEDDLDFPHAPIGVKYPIKRWHAYDD